MKTTKIILYFVLGFLIFFALPFLWPVFLYAIPVILIILGVRYLLQSERFEYAKANETFTTETNKFKDFLYRCKNRISIRSYIKPLIAVTLIFVASLFLIYFLLINIVKRQHTKQKLNELNSEIKNYKAKYNKYPKSLEELAGLDPLKQDLLRDNWGNTFIYSANNSDYALSSAGKDRVAGSNDDIVLH